MSEAARFVTFVALHPADVTISPLTVPFVTSAALGPGVTSPPDRI